MDNIVTINPKKAVEKHIAELRISYRVEDLKKTLYGFIKQCVLAHEEVKMGRKSEFEVVQLCNTRADEILEEFFRNGNGTRESMVGFLEQVITQKGRLYANKSDNK